MSKPGTPLRVRPRRSRYAGWIAAPLFFAGCAALATSLHGATGAGPAAFQRGDQVAMVGVGLAGALVILAATRPRVEADERGVRVHNLFGGYELPWSLVTAVRFNPGAICASLELINDDLVPVLAIQRFDKEYAVAAVRGLRALLAASRTPDAATSTSDAVPSTSDAVPSTPDTQGSASPTHSLGPV